MARDKHMFKSLDLPPRQNATTGKGTLNYVLDEMQNSMVGVPQQRANYKGVAAYLHLVPGDSQLPGQLP